MLMNELDDALLNEYLDGTLDAETEQVVAAQLAQIPEVQARLAELQALFATFAELEEEPLPTDLAAPILAAIRSENSLAAAERRGASAWWLPLLPLGQLLVAGLLVVFFWASLRELWDNGRTNFSLVLPAVQLPQLQVAEVLAGWLTAVTQSAAAFSPQIDLATNQWLLLVGAALLVWLLGNRLLFSNQDGGSHG
jgi:anti-sigma factor RsiW